MHTMRLIDIRKAGTAFAGSIAKKAGSAQLHLVVPSSSEYHSESSFHIRDVEHPLSPGASSSRVKSRRKAKRVRFQTVPITHEVPSPASRSKKEKKKTWYGKKELKQIQDECKETATLIRKGEIVVDTEEHCVLGLANRSHPYARQRAMHKHFHRGLVCTEQERQRREEGQVDLIVLAAKSMDFSSRCRLASFVASLPRDRTSRRRGYVN